ncbi:MAG: hypothetical protein FIB01_06025, partial [Gemmatimonadetes bacterium]|nr:hypothetical protein [Gemmatimonadota bacterium]
MTNDDIKGELTALRETMAAGFARAGGEFKPVRGDSTAGFARADGEFNTLRDEMTAGFARTDRYFELQQQQFIEFRDQAFGRLDALPARVDRLEQ